MKQGQQLLHAKAGKLQMTLNRFDTAAWHAACLKSMAVAVMNVTVLMTILNLLTRSGAWLTLVGLWFAAETLFIPVYITKYLIYNDQRQSQPLEQCAVETFWRWLHQLKQFDSIEHYLEQWFHGCSFSDIKRGNIHEWLSYTFWSRSRASVICDGAQPILEDMVDAIEQTWNVQFKPGFNRDIAFMDHLWAPMRHFYRPLIQYVFTEFMSWICHVMLVAAGFTKRSAYGVGYYTWGVDDALQLPDSQCKYYRQYEHCTCPCESCSRLRDLSPRGPLGPLPSDNAPSNGAAANGQLQRKAPFLLLHGVGLGLVPYVFFIIALKLTGHPLVIPEFRHISMRLCNSIPTTADVAEAVLRIMVLHRQERFCLLGHSYGTLVASRILQTRLDRVQAVCFIDPVCFAMFMPNLLKAFFYRAPRLSHLMRDLLIFTAARDVHCAAALSRRFAWASLNLWELPPQLPALVVLSHGDDLLPAKEVKCWLESHSCVRVMVHPTMAHAEFFLDIDWQTRIIHQLLALADSHAGAGGTGVEEIAAGHQAAGATWAPPLPAPWKASTDALAVAAAGYCGRAG